MALGAPRRTLFLAAITLVSSASVARAADELPRLPVTAVAKVAHPGSEVVVSVTLPAPAPGAPRARGMVFIAGALEREGRFTPTGNLGRAMARVLDKDGAGRLPITIRVPSDATGRLHLAAVLQAATISAIRDASVTSTTHFASLPNIET